MSTYTLKFAGVSIPLVTLGPDASSAIAAAGVATAAAAEAGVLRTDLAAAGGANLVNYQSKTSAPAILRGLGDKAAMHFDLLDFMSPAQRASVLAMDFVQAVHVPLQTMFDAKMPLGIEIELPRGGYKLETALNIPFSAGWALRALGRGAKLRQYTANAQILSFEAFNTNSWIIDGIEFDHNTQQAFGSAAAAGGDAIAFSAVDVTAQGIYHGAILNCGFNNHRRGIAHDPTVGSLAVWDMLISNCLFRSSLTGAAIRLVPQVALGQPNTLIQHNYINCAGSGVNEAALQVANCDNLVVSNVEFNGGDFGNTRYQMQLFQCNAVLSGNKSEAAAAAAGGVLWMFVESVVQVHGAQFNGLRPSGAGTVVCLYAAGSAPNPSLLSVKGFTGTIDAAFPTTWVAPWRANADGVLEVMEGYRPTQSAGGQWRTNLVDLFGATPLPRLNLAAHGIDALQFVADTAAGIAIGATHSLLWDKLIRRHFLLNVALTANRNFDLPDSATVPRDAELAIYRFAAAPGAFTWTIRDLFTGAGNSVFPANTNGMIRFVNDGGWRVLNFTLVPIPATTSDMLSGTDTSKTVTADSVAALWEQAADVASAATISLGEGGYFNITGAVAITDIDFATDKAGRRAWLKFAAAPTLTNGAALILPTGANIVTAAGDSAEFVSEGADVVRCVAYQRASGAPLLFGHAIGDGGTVTQVTSRTTGVTLNKLSGQITLVSAAGQVTYQSFTVTNSMVGVNDTISLVQKSGADLYILLVTNVAAGSFRISFATTAGVTVEQPVFIFNVIKGAVT